MRKNIAVMEITVFFILIFFYLSFAEETITITTYYPSPYGSYNELYVANRLGIGTMSPNNRLHIDSDGTSEALVFYTTGYAPSNQWGTRIYKQDCFGGFCNGIPLIIETQHGGTWYTSATFGAGQDANHPTFRSYGQTYLATGGGNVGIGTTNPMGRLHVFAANNSTAQMITINAAQASITSADTFIDFRSTTGSEGSIAGTATPGLIAYNTFTGSHWTKIDNKKGLFPNMLLEAIGEKFDNGKRQLVKTRICTSRKSQAIYGVYGGSDEKGRDLVLALGTGYIWVTNTNGDIAVGDYLQSSPLPGYAEKQEDNILHNYTAAKALEPVIWKKGETKRLIACTYHSG